MEAILAERPSWGRSPWSQEASIHRRDLHARDCAVPKMHDIVVSLRNGAEPFDGEVLDAEEEVAEGVSFDLQ